MKSLVSEDATMPGLLFARVAVCRRLPRRTRDGVRVEIDDKILFGEASRLWWTSNRSNDRVLVLCGKTLLYRAVGSITKNGLDRSAACLC